MEKPSIAICITTHNRYDTFKRSLKQWNQLKPEGADIFIIDDGSTVPAPEAHIRHNTALGIAAAKNACLRLAAGYDHVFLADDDIFPINPDWHIQFINSGFNHLQLSFELNARGQRLSHSVYQTGEHEGMTVFNAPNGVLYYLTKNAIDAIGGYDILPERWGMEHVLYSLRIHNAGLTPFPFMTPKNAMQSFYVHDFYGIKSSVPVEERIKGISANSPVFETKKHSREYIPL